jgi:hypothetical protein
LVTTVLHTCASSRRCMGSATTWLTEMFRGFTICEYALGKATH